MSKSAFTLGLLLACFQYGGSAAPTWPASTDELEDILFLTSGYRASGFATLVTPCNKEFETGRITSAAWLRTAFHDMATGNAFTRVGGLDGSLQFEFTNGESDGKAFPTSLAMWGSFLSSKTSLSDVIAAAVYTSTRSCGGLPVPIRGGHVDATGSGQLGVPQPQNTAQTFEQQFTRMGFNKTAMIQLVACGHTLGSAHAPESPQIVQAGTLPLDTTPSTFDSKIATEYVSGTTKNPLVVGISVNSQRNSDRKVFGSDNNATIGTLQDTQTFSRVCQSLFQQMIELVPAGVTLSDVIAPYDVKPYDIQLTLLDGGEKLKFTGDIRIRTTLRKNVAQVQLVYKDRTGAAVSTPIGTTVSGTASGFDDTFLFFGFSTEIPSGTSISSFDVVVTVAGGTSQTFNNNGNSFKVDDTLFYQAPQSCVVPNNGIRVAAARRISAQSTPSLRVVEKKPKASPNPVPSLAISNIALNEAQGGSNDYVISTATYVLASPGTPAMFGVYAGALVDVSKSTDSLPTTCKPFNASPSPTEPSSPAFAYQGCYYDAAVPRALPSEFLVNDNMTIERCSAFCTKYQLFGLEYGRECYCGDKLDSTSTIQAISDCNMPCSGNQTETCGAASRLSLYKNLKYVPPSSTSPTSTPTGTPSTSSTPTPTSTPSLQGYDYVGCLSDAVENRTLHDKFETKSDNSYTACAAFCSGYEFFGVEYAAECYCGISLAYTDPKPLSDCSMPCTGDPKSYCGAGNRLTVFKNKTPIRAPTNPPIEGYKYKGCYTDSVNKRTLSEHIYFDAAMTVDKCAAQCTSYKYFGTEYGGECYCGNMLSADTATAAESDCQFLCGGDKQQLCGAGDRLSLYEKSS
ncbi:unnamed protein product [Periconia digitata]|uniref:Uncharacterized protein n=1 Tax=Periconia digitata TaxID=1303443 RepID=A0A9W4UDH1_9PLEO|nr:unnamed protein product [Periconia digitata]